MRLLLDTHILVWSTLQPKRLNRRVARILEDRRTERWLSPVSVWEVISGVRGGKIRLRMDPLDWIKAILEKGLLREAALSYEVALEAGRFELPHRDPFDRLIVATARARSLTLVTSDANIIASGTVPVLEGS